MTGLSGLTLTSHTGAKSVVMPMARSSRPVIAAAVRASVALRARAERHRPGQLGGRRTDARDDALLLVDRDRQRHACALAAAGPPLPWRSAPSAARWRPLDSPRICSGSRTLSVHAK